MMQGQFTDYLYADKRVIRAGGSGYRQYSARSELGLSTATMGDWSPSSMSRAAARARR